MKLRLVIKANAAVPSKFMRTGASAVITNNNNGSGGERVRVLVVSRLGRRIDIWVPIKSLTNFRVVTAPADARNVNFWESRESAEEWIKRMCEFWGAR